MNKKILLLLILFVIVACNNNSTNEYRGSNEFYPGLYTEIYNVYSGGVLGGDVAAYYFTDSINFRQYVGKNGDDERMVWDYKWGRVIFKNKSKDNEKVLESWVFNLNELKRNKVFAVVKHR